MGILFSINPYFLIIGQPAGQEILEDLIRFANSHNISFYALDPDNYLRYVLGDMAYDNFPRSSYTLSSFKSAGIQKFDEMDEIKKIESSKLDGLAKDTRGDAFLGGKKFEEFQKVIERDFAFYYELSYTPLKKEADGRYHRIEVKVSRPDIDLRYRQRYQDYTDDQQRRDFPCFKERGR